MKFTGKYETIIESTITRFSQGGVLSGDLVKIRKDALKNEKVKANTEPYQKALENAMNTDLNLRVCAVKSIRPTTTGDYGGGHNSGTRAPTDYFVDIVIEYAPGLWRDPITVPLEILEIVDTNGNLSPIPDSLKRKNKVEMPQTVNSSDKNRKNPDKNTKPEFNPTPTDGRKHITRPVEVTKKNQGKLTLEAVYDNILTGNNNNTPLKGYTITFGQPYGKNPDAIINKIEGMEGMSNNMNKEWLDDNTLKIKFSGDIDSETLRKMITNVVDGTVDVSEDQDDITEFEPNKSVEIASGSPSIGA